MAKTLGVVGGMGPLATADFYRRITEKTPTHCQEDHLHIIINSNPTIPSRWRHFLFDESSPVPDIISSIRLLESAGCDLVALPCNNVHYFYDEVTKHTAIPWVNMLECVSSRVNRFAKVLILGSYITTKAKTYDRYLDNAVYLSTNQDETHNLDFLMNIIDRTKTNRRCEEPVISLLEYIQSTFRDVDAVLLACTELPIAFRFTGGNYDGITIIDSIDIYIDALLERIL